MVDARGSHSFATHSVANVVKLTQAFATRWLWSYNHERPHMALDGLTPMQKLAMAD